MKTIEGSTLLQIITIPSLGQCVLMMLSDKNESNTATYETYLSIAKRMKLEELENISHNYRQELFNCLARQLSKTINDKVTEVRVLISGTHASFASINMRVEQQPLEECVTSMNIYFCGKNNPFWFHVEMTTEEIPISEPQKVDEDCLVVCLFLGVPEPLKNQSGE